jgi:hypothetical protein
MFFIIIIAHHLYLKLNKRKDLSINNSMVEIITKKGYEHHI